MGKFGKNKLPKFMNKPDDRIGSNPHIQEEHQDDEMQPTIVSMSGHGDDHAMIVIRTKSGEELELQFNYDGEGMLTAQHGEHEYSIPVEVEYVETEEVDEKLKGKQVKLDKNHNGKIDSEDFKLLNKSKKSKKDTEGKVAETFEGFVNECWTPMEEGYNLAMSEEAKRAIKALCEEMLIQEAQRCDEDADPMHTYENYLNECGSYMTECMMEAAASVPVEESEEDLTANQYYPNRKLRGLDREAKLAANADFANDPEIANPTPRGIYSCKNCGTKYDGYPGHKCKKCKAEGMSQDPDSQSNELRRRHPIRDEDDTAGLYY